MKTFLQKFREGIYFWIWFLATLAVWVFAYTELQTVNQWEPLTADSYNSIVNTVNDLQKRVANVETQNQDAFDTNEIWTWKYDKQTWKKVYSKWVYFWNMPYSTISNVTHWIIGIETITDVKPVYINKSTWMVYTSRNDVWTWANKDYISIYALENWSHYIAWVQLYYTKTTD